MKQYFYRTLLLLAGTSLSAMQNINNNNQSIKTGKEEVNRTPRLKLLEHADTAASASFSEKTATQINNLLHRFSGQYEEVEFSSLKSARLIRWNKKPTVLTTTDINAIFAGIPEADRSTPEQVTKLLQHMSHTVLRVEKESKENLEHAKQMAVENKWDTVSLKNGAKELAASVVLASLPPLFYKKFSHLCSTPYALTNIGMAVLTGTLLAIPASIISFLNSMSSFDTARSHSKKLQEQIKSEQIQYDNIQLLKPYMCIENQSGSGIEYLPIDTIEQAQSLSIWSDFKQQFKQS